MNQINCPRCSTSMKTVELDGVAVETCNTCGGIYLDKGELDAVSRDTEGSVEFCTATDKALATDDGRDLIRCPKCSEDAFMDKVEFNGVTSIVLDRCLGCEGIWLDHGELAQIDEHIKGLEDTDWSASLSFWMRLQVMASQIGMSTGL